MKKSLFAENYEKKHGVPWQYTGEKIDPVKMNKLKDHLRQYFYNDNAEKLIFGDGKPAEPNYKIYIAKEDWDKIKKDYADTEADHRGFTNKYIKLALSNLIDEYKVRPPFPKITEQDAKKSFIQLAHDPEMFHHLSRKHRELKDKRRNKDGKTYSLELIRRGLQWYRFPSDNYPVNDEDGMGFYIHQSDDGMKASNFFHHITRHGVDHKSYPAPFEVWKNPKTRKRLLQVFWKLFRLHGYVDTSRLNSALRTDFYIASQFRPASAKCLYRLFDAKNVLDPSSGWGDRLVGFLATPHTEKYLGFDPNTALHDGYNKQIKLYGRALEPLYGIKKNVKIHCKGSEVFDYKNHKGKFDIVFTSPPYFDTEHYSKDESQSWMLYKTSDAWLNDFLFRMIEKTWSTLRDGGIMAMNITSQKKGTKMNNLTDPMNDFISSLPGASWIGQLGMRIAVRPSFSKEIPRDAVMIEPIWIWGKKTDGKKLRDYVVNKKKFLYQYEQPDKYELDK